MGTIDQYREIVRRLILDYAQYKPSHGDIATEAIIDPEHNHFELMHVGWDGPRRVHGAVIHIDIIADKIWIQHDGTEYGVANNLVEAGVPKDKIVLAFKSPELRKYTDFAVA